MGALFKVVVILLILVGAGGAYAYTSYVKPLSALQLHPAGMEPVSINPLIIRVSVDIVNPGKSVRLPGADLNLYAGEKLIGKGTLPGGIIPSGSTRLQAEITIDKGIEELTGLSSGREELSVDGTLSFNVLSFNVKVPVPRVPVPGGLDIASLAGGEAPDVSEILPLLQENRGQKLVDALASDNFRRKYKEKTGKELTETKIQELMKLFGEEAMNKTIGEIMGPTH
jgi:hypothetical protein